MTTCRWCKGTGAVNLKIIRMFFRWRRILAVNATMGRLSLPPFVI
jgi:hypothetical protein